MPNIAGVINVGKGLVMAHRPEILLGAAIAAGVGAVVLAARGGYKSGQEVLMAEAEKGEPMTVQEKAVLTWQNYVPAAAALVVGVGSTAALHVVHVKTQKALIATGLAAVEEIRTSAKAYIDDLHKSIDENSTPKTADKIEEGLHSRLAERGVIDFTHDAWYEPVYPVRDKRTGRDRPSNRIEIEEAIHEINNRLSKNEPVDLNSFYHLAGYDSIPDGDIVGWNAGEHVNLVWELTSRDDGQPTKVFSFRPQPNDRYDSSR
jgi:hypothetical protein